MKKIKLIIIMVYGLSLISTAALKPGQLSEVRRNAKSSEECINGFKNLLYDEIQNPTVTHKGWGGGYITHDYKMAQITTAIINQITPMTISGPATPDIKIVKYVKQLESTETLPEAKDVWEIVLANCKDAEVLLDLINLIKEDHRPYLRNKAVHGLRIIGDIIVIPDLLILLKDTASNINSNTLPPERTIEYPVRQAAFIALKQLGVDIKRNGNSEGTIPFEYLVNTNSAIQVLTKELNNISDDTNRSKALLHAISRVGGEYSRKALEDYIDRNKTLPDKKELVATAEDLLTQLPRPKK